MRRLIDLGSTASHNDHYVRINREARAVLEWRHLFLETWNGVAMTMADSREVPDIVLTSDASGNWGCGSYSGGKWFMLPWSTKFQNCHITVKELAPIVVAAIIWREDWRGKTILARSDNSAVVAIIRGGMSRNSQAANITRCLTFLSAVYQFKLLATHVRGIHNILADALSRNNLHLFQSLNPQADERATPIPESVLDLVLLQEPDWTTRNWTSR